jgi:hypothetical protein
VTNLTSIGDDLAADFETTSYQKKRYRFHFAKSAGEWRLRRLETVVED